MIELENPYAPIFTHLSIRCMLQAILEVFPEGHAPPPIRLTFVDGEQIDLTMKQIFKIVSSSPDTVTFFTPVVTELIENLRTMQPRLYVRLRLRAAQLEMREPDISKVMEQEGVTDDMMLSLLTR